jgi:hypothetical protein
MIDGKSVANVLLNLSAYRKVLGVFVVSVNLTSRKNKKAKEPEG